MPKLVLFDIDGTLVLTGRRRPARDEPRLRGRCSVTRDALDGIPVAGRTDWIILHDALARIGRELDDGSVRAAARRATCVYLREEIEHAGRGRQGRDAGHPRRCSTRSQREPDVFLGAAHRQLRAERAHQAGALRSVALLPLRRVRRRCRGSQCAGAVRASSGRARCGLRARSRRTTSFVVGDTPHDVACAHAAGARAGRRRDRHVHRRCSCAPAARTIVFDGSERHGMRSCACSTSAVAQCSSERRGRPAVRRGAGPLAAARID